MKIGIVGCGGIAHVHVPIILKQRDASIVGIADTSVEAANTLAAQFKIDHVYENAEDMIDQQKPDIVHVLVPPQYHAQLSIMAMNHGCHVLVEKPMAISVEDAKEMIEAAESNNIRLCVDHSSAFGGVVERTKELIREGVVGDVVSVEAKVAYDVSRSPETLMNEGPSSHWSYQMPGGPLQDIIPHQAFLVLEHIQDIKEIKSIFFNRGILPHKWPDEIRMLVTSNNVIGYISVSLSERPDIETLTIKGTKGLVCADWYNNQVTIRKESKMSRKISRGLSGFELAFQNFKGSLDTTLKFATGRIGKADGIETVISSFYESVSNDSELPVSLDSSLRVVELINRIWPVPAAPEMDKLAKLPQAQKEDKG